MNESFSPEKMDLDLQRDSGSTHPTTSSMNEPSFKNISPYFQRIQDALTEKTFCSGTYQVSPEECVLFYGKEKGATGRINLSAATEDELSDLMRVCDPATFGHGQVDVLDESYRKAKKLDTSHFSSKFDLCNTRLTEIVRSELLEGEDDHSKLINAELYKLNIYDQGAFFKAHKDTPRSEAMFGSLVIVFPTSHEGGAFTLRHAGMEWTIDSDKAISDQSSPCIAYIALFSDVEHEVALVTSGYRVTLTYNLYFTAKMGNLGDSTDLGVPAVRPSEESVRAIFDELLSDSTFLPDGGRLGFGLNHQYPFSSESSQSLDTEMLHRLKGSDALIFRVCQEYHLKAHIRVIYKGNDGYDIMCPEIVSLHDYQQIDDLDGCLIENEQGVQLVDEDDEDEEPTINWVTKMTNFNTHKAHYVAYGNEASLAYVYGQLVLIVKVGRATRRATIRGTSDSV